MMVEPAAPPRGRFHLLSFLLALLNGLGVLGGLLSGLMLLVFGSLESLGAAAERSMLAGLGWSMLGVMALLLPGLIYAIRRLAGRERPAFQFANPRQISRILVFIWPALMLGMYFAAQNSRLAAWILPLMQFLVVGIPLWFLLEISRRGLPDGKAHQAWGVFSAGALVTMPLVFLVEGILVLAVVILAVNAILGQDLLMEELNRLTMRLGSGNVDPEVISRALLPFLRRPAVLVSILLTASGLVPLVEELFKPLGMWVLGRKWLSPAQGFNLGMVSGAAFALLESLGYLSSVSGPDWVLTALGRVGSGLLHITASGLVGWGLAEAWSNRRFGRLALGYTAAVILHGLWNLFGILVGLVPLIDVTAGLVGILRGLGLIAPYALGVLGVGMFLILMGMNAYLRRSAAPEIQMSYPRLVDAPGELATTHSIDVPIGIIEEKTETVDTKEKLNGTDQNNH